MANPGEGRRSQKPFTGEYTCKELDTAKLTLRDHRVADVQERSYGHFDARDGKLDESSSYRHAKLHGSLKRYRDGVAYLES